MDKTAFYSKLNIDDPSEFIYYENMASVMEEDDYIEKNLITDLFRSVPADVLFELTDSYFEEFLKSLPDEETDLYIVVDGIRRAITGLIIEDMQADDISLLADEFLRFRDWYVTDALVHNNTDGSMINVRDARYNIIASRFIDEPADYSFNEALLYDLDGYDVRLADIIAEDESEEMK